MLKTVDIGTREGQISHLTVGPDRNRITIECYEEKMAYWVERSGNTDLKVGDWLLFQGSARVEVVKPGNEAKPDPYYHDPKDGSDKSRWSFQELRPDDFVFMKAAPPEVKKALREVRDVSIKALEKWDGSMAESARLILALQKASNAIQESLTPKLQNLAEPVLTVDLDSLS